MASLEVTDATFEQEVISSPIPVIVDFWAPWCVPCKIISPILEELAETHAGKVKIAKVNVDENQESALRYGVMSIPNVKFFKNGQIFDEIIGAAPKEHYLAILQKSFA